MSCGVDRRHGSDLALLWLWYRPAATALIRPLAWEHPYAMGAALKGQITKKNKKQKTKQTKKNHSWINKQPLSDVNSCQSF